MDQIYKEVKERIFKEYEYDENDKKEVEIKPKEKKSNYLQKIFLLLLVPIIISVLLFKFIK